MKLGLIRHFKVITSQNTFLSSKEFAKTMSYYDVAPVRENDLKIITNEWDICYCSNLPRSIKTAEAIYKKEIIKTELLVEVPISAFVNTNFPFPNFLWHLGSRIAWYFNSKSQKEGYLGTNNRILEFLNVIENSNHKNILIITHGFFMRVFIKQLRNIGFKGFVDFAPKNGKLYTFKN